MEQMIQSLKKFWQASSDNTPGVKHGKQLVVAVAVLLVEVMRIDGHLEKAEHQEIVRALEKRFQLSATEVNQIIEQAKTEASQANDLHKFTSQVIKHFSAEERIDILRELWRVAMADGHVDPYEEQLIRRTAELIGVYHHEFIQAKISAHQKLA